MNKYLVVLKDEVDVAAFAEMLKARYKSQISCIVRPALGVLSVICSAQISREIAAMTDYIEAISLDQERFANGNEGR